MVSVTLSSLLAVLKLLNWDNRWNLEILPQKPWPSCRLSWGRALLDGLGLAWDTPKLWAPPGQAQAMALGWSQAHTSLWVTPHIPDFLVKSASGPVILLLPAYLTRSNTLYQSLDDVLILYASGVDDVPKPSLSAKMGLLHTYYRWLYNPNPIRLGWAKIWLVKNLISLKSWFTTF